MLSCPIFGPLLAGLRPATIHYSFFIRLQGASLRHCPLCTPPPLLLRAEKKRSAVHGVGEEEGLGCKPRWTRASIRWPYAMWQAWQKFGTNLHGPPFSFRCRWLGAHAVRYFFTIHSYLLLLLASPGADGGGAQCAHWAEGVSTGVSSCGPSLLHSSLLLLTSAKRARGPGPGRPRRLQVCRRFAPAPAGPDKKQRLPLTRELSAAG